jgi:hypothetical protein
MFNKIEEARELVRNSVVDGKSGIDIAKKLKESDYSIEDAKASLEEFGFVAAILSGDDVQSPALHVSENITLPGIAQLALNILAKKLPKVIWNE